MPTIADSTITATGDVIQPSPQSVTTVVADGTGSIVPIRSTLPAADVLATVTAASLTVNGVPVQATWQPIPPAVSGGSAAAASATTNIPPAASAAGVPWQLISASASENVVKLPGGVINALVSIDFTRATGDPNYSYTQVWVTGYAGDLYPATHRIWGGLPIEFLLQATGELVTFTMVAVGAGGAAASFSGAPTATLTLNGVVTAPPAPTISQTATALSGSAGWQFAWNVLSGLIADVISGYWVYVSATDDVTTATRYQFFSQPPSNIGVLTFQQFTSATNYYWVSSVNTSGLESTLTPTTAITVTHSYYPTVTAGGFDSPSNAYDQNETTASTGATTSPGTVHTTDLLGETWSAFPAFSGAATSVVLKVMTAMGADYDNTIYDGHAHAQGSISYSLDGGTTWSTLFSETNSTAAAYVTATLPNTQDLTLVQVQATSSSSSPTGPPTGGGDPSTCDMALLLFEIRIEVTE